MRANLFWLNDEQWAKVNPLEHKPHRSRQRLLRAVKGKLDSSHGHRESPGDRQRARLPNSHERSADQLARRRPAAAAHAPSFGLFADQILNWLLTNFSKNVL